MKVVRVTDGDWEGYYVDGELVIQDHIVDANRLIEALGIEIEELDCDMEWLAAEGHLPEKLEDVKLNEPEPKKTKKKGKKNG